MRVHLIGYGKMGKELHSLVNSQSIKLGDIITSKKELLHSLKEKKESDVYLDFTQPDIVLENLKTLAESGAKVVCGTTGWLKDRLEVEELFKHNNGAFLFASNFSIGMNIVFLINEQMAHLSSNLGDFEVRIEETHHIHKKDAPSGTAVSLATGIISHNPNYTKWELDGQGKEVLPIRSIREGEVFGEHQVIFESKSEKVVIRHSAKNRRVFAEGALVAARFISDKTGIYTMRDLLITDK